MSLYENDLYMEDVRSVANLELPWDNLRYKSIMISGATGLIGSFLIDVIFEQNLKNNLGCKVYVLGRSEEKAKRRFHKYYSNADYEFVPYDVNQVLQNKDIKKVDFILHLASNTHPILYSTDPIGTITTNIIGLQNMLDFAFNHQATRVLFASSNEIYGENRGDSEFFDEKYCGYIDCNTLRAGYPESKRCGEALCQAYISQKNMDIVIARFTRSYGPTIQMSDTKAISQFIKKGIAGEDIVLKSTGTQYYSYTYVADAVSGLLYTLLLGEKGEAYNVADISGDIMLKDLAASVAKVSGSKVVFEIPDAVESAGYSKATKARLDGSKISKLGWKPRYTIMDGISRTIEILQHVD